MEGFARRPEVLSERVTSSPVSLLGPSRPALRSPLPPGPHSLPATSPLGRPGVLRDGSRPIGPLRPEGGRVWVAEGVLQVFLMDGRQVRTGNGPVSGGGGRGDMRFIRVEGAPSQLLS